MYPATIDPQLPLIDLHRHIDGSVRLTTILELGKKPATLDAERIQSVVEQPIGTKVDVVYLREGKKASATMTLAEILRP